jgi:hypothetical protein
MSHTPVFWRSNRKAWVIKQLLLDWFNYRFVNEVEEHLAFKNLIFIILHVLEIAPGQPLDLSHAHQNMHTQYLPQNTTMFLQPLDLAIIKTFMTYYTCHTFHSIFDASAKKTFVNVSGNHTT